MERLRSITVTIVVETNKRTGRAVIELGDANATWGKDETVEEFETRVREAIQDLSATS